MDPNPAKLTPGSGQQAELSVIVVAKVRLYREGLAKALDGMNHVRISGSCATVESTTAMIEERRPDVAIVDMEIPGALELIADMRTECPGTRFIAFGVDDDIGKILDCAKAGAAGYVTANASLDELLNAVERAVAGELLCTPRVAAELFRRMSEAVAQQPDSGSSEAVSLTVREVQVFGYVQRGLSNKEIAAALSIAESTVKNHVHHLLEKLRVGSRAQAMARATLNPPRTLLTSSRRKTS